MATMRPVDPIELQMQRVENNTKHRKKLMEEYCAKNFVLYNGFKNNDSYISRSIFNHKYKFVMCLAEKTGCSFFKRILYYFSGHKSISSPFILTLGAAHTVPQNITNKLSKTELAKVMANYHKFIFVRNPYQRLFSGYVDKVFSRYDAWMGFIKQVISVERPSVKEKDKNCIKDVSFAELVGFVSKRLAEHKGVDGHFMPIHQHCNPCSAKYDFVGSLENFQNDATYLFRKLKLGNQDIIDQAKAVSVNDELLDAAHIIFGDISNKKLMANPCFDIFNFSRRTWRKLQIKGLISTKIDFPLTRDDLLIINEVQFVTILKSAYLDSQNDPELRNNKKNSYLEAVYAIPEKDLIRLSEVLKAECDIWGYSNRPDILFDINNRKSTGSFKYFNFDDVS